MCAWHAGRFASGTFLRQGFASAVGAAHSIVSDRPPSLGLKWLCVTAFVLSAVPRARGMVGPVPLYLLDVCALVTLYYSRQAKARDFSRARKLRGAILAFGLFIAASQLGNAVNGRWVLEPTYMLVRYALALSVFFSAQRLISSLRDVTLLFQSLTLGLAITSLLIVLVALPPTRGLTSPVFNNRFLEPVAERGSVKAGDADVAQRGRSLVGTSTLSGGFINTLWPFALFVASSASVAAGWKRAAMFAAVVAPFGAAMTYARGAVLGTGLSVLAFSTVARGAATKYAVATVLIAVAAFQWIGWDSDLFRFARYEERFRATIEAPLEEGEERARVLSYTEPFVHLANNPLSFFVGRGGTAGHRSPNAPVSPEGEEVDHSSFGWSFFGFGAIAAFCNVFMIAYATLRMYRVVQSGRNPRDPQEMAARCLFASVLGMLPWWLFGHASASDPRGMMLYMLVLGLVAAFPERQWSATHRRKSTPLLGGLAQ
jgi:hypothetical protein